MGLPPSGQTNLEKKEQLTRNSERFLALPKHTKEQLLSDFEVIQKQLQRSFWDKLTSVLGLFAHKISPYELAWIFFSVAISILLLKRVEGASQAVWLLPLLAALYAADSQWYGRNDPHAFEAKLFPSENELVSNYMDSPLSEDIFEQQRQMMQGWKRYLVLKWARQMPSSDQAAFDRQVEEGEFNFTLARLELRSKQKDFLSLKKSNPPPHFLLLILYFFWNTYFAYTAWKYTRLCPVI